MKKKKEKKIEASKLVLYKSVKIEDGTLERRYITTLAGALSTKKSQAYKFDDIDSARNFAQAHGYLGRLNTGYAS